MLQRMKAINHWTQPPRKDVNLLRAFKWRFFLVVGSGQTLVPYMAPVTSGELSQSPAIFNSAII